MNEVDILVVGSGAGGAPIALRLAQAGCSVLVLEKGREHPRHTYPEDEVQSLRRSFWMPAFGEEPHVLWRQGAAQPEPTLWGWTASCVGGGTVVMGAYLYRFHPDDFRLRSRLGPFEEVEDWPYDYEELEPYYCAAERELGISGQAADHPHHSPRSQPYPLPPLRSHPLTSDLAEACEHIGLHPFPTPRGILSQPYGGRAACSYCGFCAGYGCRTGAKSSTQEALLPRAVATGHCEVRPQAMVREITVTKSGRAAGCIYLDAQGQEHEVKARVVCVAGSAVESARLLLLSRSSLFPDGLANDSGRVGRHLQFHSFSNGHARFRYQRHSKLPLRDPHPFLDLSALDHYFLPPGDADYPKGGLIRFGLPGSSPISAALRAAEDGDRLVWGAELKERIQSYFHDYRMVDFEVFHDFFPNAATYVQLETAVRDRWGLAAAGIRFGQLEQHRQVGRRLVDRGLEALEAMGADELVRESEGEVAGILVHGTCRAGRDPRRSVLDPFCRAHQVPNLYVVDASFMPTSGGAPPTLTIVANSLRTADHILARAGRGELG